MRVRLQTFRSDGVCEAEALDLSLSFLKLEADVVRPGKEFVLHPKWYEEIVPSDVRPERPGIYEWRIEGVGVYIGQYTRHSRPRRAYGLSVANILNGRPYRKNNPCGFRSIHCALAGAVECGRRVTLSFLENVPDRIERNARERGWIAQRRREADQGGLPVLNGN